MQDPRAVLLYIERILQYQEDSETIVIDVQNPTEEQLLGMENIVAFKRALARLDLQQADALEGLIRHFRREGPNWFVPDVNLWDLTR